ncbi:hypothetical protein A9K55_001822 [Cordyceps militaris]|uniref:Uncharacterized protein n=1 Tax=Cordyceps militaris TaxID=73501 RepID=A0A2H4SSA4_CORMI|nr:hypothetical protein A9K55_001822 [Cordyceps militaris]
MAAQITDSPKFEGWYIHPDGTTEALTCPQGTFTVSGKFAACCGQSKCAIATTCKDNKLTYDNFAIGSCPGSAVCQTMSVMAAPGATDVTSSIFCAQYWYAIEAYRDTVPVTTASATTTSSSSSTSASTGSTPTSNTASSTTDPSSSTAPLGTTAPTRPAASPDPSTGGSASKAWIAGAVVGALAGLALLAFAIWFLRRRAQKKRLAAAANAPQEIGGYERPADGNWQNKQYFGASHPKSESTSAGYYAPVQQNQVHELPSGEHVGQSEPRVQGEQRG